MGFGWFVWLGLDSVRRLCSLLGGLPCFFLFSLHTRKCGSTRYRPCMHGAAQAKYRVSGHGDSLGRRLLGGGIDMPGARSVVNAAVPDLFCGRRRGSRAPRCLAAGRAGRFIAVHATLWAWWCAMARVDPCVTSRLRIPRRWLPPLSVQQEATPVGGPAPALPRDCNALLSKSGPGFWGESSGLGAHITHRCMGDLVRPRPAPPWCVHFSKAIEDIAPCGAPCCAAARRGALRRRGFARGGRRAGPAGHTRQAASPGRALGSRVPCYRELRLTRAEAARRLGCVRAPASALPSMPPFLPFSQSPRLNRHLQICLHSSTCPVSAAAGRGLAAVR
jgi:hypothetical protein